MTQDEIDAERAAVEDAAKKVVLDQEALDHEKITRMEEASVQQAGDLPSSVVDETSAAIIAQNKIQPDTPSFTVGNPQALNRTSFFLMLGDRIKDIDVEGFQPMVAALRELQYATNNMSSDHQDLLAQSMRFVFNPPATQE